jgi:hypothetical protein
LKKKKGDMMKTSWLIVICAFVSANAFLAGMSSTIAHWVAGGNVDAMKVSWGVFGLFFVCLLANIGWLIIEKTDQRN